MPRILIVDDNPELLTVLAEGLKRNGFQVVTATNGLEALHAAEKDHLDAVVTDIIMPEREGLETIRELRIGHPDVRIVAMSGRGFAGTGRLDFLQAARAFGAGEILQKPFRITDLIEALARMSILPPRTD